VETYTWQWSPYSALLLAVALAAVISAYYIRKYRPVPWINTGTAMLFAAAAWSSAYALEISSTGLQAKILWSKVAYLGIAIVPPVWLTFVLRYTGQSKRLLRQSHIVLGIMTGIVVLLILTNELHGIVWSSLAVRPRHYLGETYVDLANTPAWGYWCFVACFVAAILLAACLLIVMLVRSRPFYRWQVFILLGGMLVDMYVGINEIWGDSYPNYLPLAFALTSLFIIWGLSYLRRGDLVAVSRRLVLESMPDPVLVLDEHNRVMSLNPACRRLIGDSNPGPIGRVLEQVWPTWAAQVGSLNQGDEIRREVTLEVDGQERAYDVRISPLTDWRDRLVSRVAVLRDISERRQTEQENEALQTQLLQARKMEAVGTLAGGIAHDFNNLLTAIQGNATLAKNTVGSDSPIYEDLREIELACMRATRLTRQLLLFSRKQPIQPIALQLNAVILELTEMLERLIGEDVTIYVHLAPDAWMVQADKGSMEQVIINLVVNARDAMPHGGEITVKTENVIVDDVYCQATPEARPGRFVRLTVSDTGIGMSQEIQERLFEPFFSTKEVGEGTGLGLSVVYGIVQQHSGWVHVYSEVSQGSTFTIHLPTAQEAAAEPAPVEEPSVQDLQGHGERILLVEDEESVREFGARVLRQNGYDVLAVSGVQEAIDVLDQDEWRFDLVFSDVVLPDQSGIELADYVLAHRPSLHILLSSGYTGQRSRWSTIRDRGLAFLEKPYTLTKLLGTIRAAIEQ
jgi:PAS domain S-box-containing protein